MSPSPHREKDAKVEGRDRPEAGLKETMAPFRRLMGRLLNVKPDEVAEQQRLYEIDREAKPDKPSKMKRKKVVILPGGAEAAEKKLLAKRPL